MVPNVLLVRLDGLGDALVCVPALEALRRRYPGAAFGALCSPANAALFSKSRVARIHVFPSGGDESQERALRGELREANYTHALVATEEPVGYAFARASGAARRAGFWHRFEKPLKSLWQFSQLTDAVYRPAAWVSQPEHEVLALHRLAVRLGAEEPPTTDVDRLRPWMRVTAGPPDLSTSLLFQVARKWTAGGWDAQALASMLAVALAASPFRRCRLACAPEDAGLSQAIVERLPPATIAENTVTRAAPQPLDEWLGVIASAGAVVSPDTGAAHAAGMLGVPVVDVFEAARFEQLSRQWRPWAAPSRCLIKPAIAANAPASLGAAIAAALTELSSTADVPS